MVFQGVIALPGHGRSTGRGMRFGNQNMCEKLQMKKAKVHYIFVESIVHQNTGGEHWPRGFSIPVHSRTFSSASHPTAQGT